MAAGAIQVQQFLTSLCVPDRDNTVLACRKDALAVVREEGAPKYGGLFARVCRAYCAYIKLQLAGISAPGSHSSILVRRNKLTSIGTEVYLIHDHWIPVLVLCAVCKGAHWNAAIELPKGSGPVLACRGHIPAFWVESRPPDRSFMAFEHRAHMGVMVGNQCLSEAYLRLIGFLRK